MCVFLLGHNIKFISEDIHQEILKATVEWELVGYLSQIDLGLNSNTSMRVEPVT